MSNVLNATNESNILPNLVSSEKNKGINILPPKVQHNTRLEII